MFSEDNKNICRRFAQLFDYPDSHLAFEITRLSRQLDGSPSDVTGPLKSFSDYTAGLTLSNIEELYTQTFDMVPSACLYVGFHLFGETPKRSVFLIRLREAYQAVTFDGGTELADHLGVILRFLSVSEDEEFVRPLLDECLLPVLDKILEETQKNGSVYGDAIRSVKAFLQHASRERVQMGVD